MNNVYHGSKVKGLKIITKRKSTHLNEWVYATFSKAVALIFISNNGSDLYYYLGGCGTKEEPIVLVERKENMFNKIFNVSGSLYTLDGENFTSGKTGWSAEVVSEYDETVINEEHVENIMKKLIELDSANELKLYLYPNRPKYIPSDNSDLIPKVINWKKKGLNISEFFEIYPELKTKFFEQLEAD